MQSASYTSLLDYLKENSILLQRRQAISSILMDGMDVPQSEMSQFLTYLEKHRENSKRVPNLPSFLQGKNDMKRQILETLCTITIVSGTPTIQILDLCKLVVFSPSSWLSVYNAAQDLYRSSLVKAAPGCDVENLHSGIHLSPRLQLELLECLRRDPVGSADSADLKASMLQ